MISFTFSRINATFKMIVLCVGKSNEKDMIAQSNEDEFCFYRVDVSTAILKKSNGFF